MAEHLKNTQINIAIKMVKAPLYVVRMNASTLTLLFDRIEKPRTEWEYNMERHDTAKTRQNAKPCNLKCKWVCVAHSCSVLSDGIGE